MIQESSNPLFNRNLLFVKAGLIVGIIFLLCSTLNLVESLLVERLTYRNEAVHSITSTWGGEQTILGPVLIIPFQQSGAFNSSPERKVGQKAYYLPLNLDIDSTINTENRRRGIFEALLYSGSFTIKGFFPPLLSIHTVAENLNWDEAVISFSFSDLRGIKESLTLSLGDESFPLQPGSLLPDFPQGVHAKIGNQFKSPQPIPFSLRLSLNGSAAVRFVSLGQQTTVKMNSNWTDPSFDGALLPIERRINENGFSALWKTSHYASLFPRSWIEQGNSFRLTRKALDGASFGVRLINPVDAYRLTERSIKYGILVMVLTFAVFFIYEVISRVPLHPFQYGLVGAALALFYLTLLSISEVLPFGISYLISTLLCSGMIIFYIRSFIPSLMAIAAISLNLLATYFFIYLILQLEDFALLAGTSGLFLALSSVMYFTRNINWYGGNTLLSSGGSTDQTKAN